MKRNNFDWKSLQKYFTSQSADDLNRFLEKLPQNAGQTALVAAGIAWAMAAALGLYTAVHTQKLTELRAELKATEALKPAVPTIKNVAIPKAEVDKFVKDSEKSYRGLTIKSKGSTILITSRRTADFVEFREALGHMQNGGDGWRVSLDKLCVGRECDRQVKLMASVKVNQSFGRGAKVIKYTDMSKGEAMVDQEKSNNRYTEKGNVLFLILIAVALFAALSYAVTQSTRSGGGTTDKEKAILSGASMTQHPTALRTSIIRMILAGIDVENIKFNAPANFSAVSEQSELIFHPTGGGGVFQRAPAELMAGGSQGNWFYNANWIIPQIGIDTAGSGNDIVAFLPGVSRTVCEQVNDQFAINTNNCTLEGAVPELDSGADDSKIAELMDDGYTFPTTAETLQGDGGSCVAFSGQPAGCFYEEATNDEYVFYSVLLER